MEGRPQEVTEIILVLEVACISSYWIEIIFLPRYYWGERNLNHLYYSQLRHNGTHVKIKVPR